MRPRHRTTFRCLPVAAATLAGLALLAACAQAPAREAREGAQAAAAPDSPAPVRKLAHTEGEPVAVTIYEFRSGIYELPARGTTDMFITALAQSGKFRVVERAQLNQGIMTEKQLNSQGLSTGDVAQQPLRGAQYIFEGSITEANPTETQRSSSVNVAGMSVSGGKSEDVVGIDVRILDAATGDVLDTVVLRKAIKSKASGVSGVGNLLGTFLSRHHVDTTYTPDVSVQQQRKESLDEALRALIAEAVTQLAARF
jgi:curli biogenesis system outer membrane secretion channel CsgG